MTRFMIFDSRFTIGARLDGSTALIGARALGRFTVHSSGHVQPTPTPSPAGEIVNRKS
jgi:hypothetical protein